MVLLWATNLFAAHNKTIGNSYIYDHKITHRARKSTLSVSIAGEALSQGDINKLYEQLQTYGIERNQFVINQNSTFVPESINEQDFVKSIFEQNEQEIRKREQLISEMEKELKAYKLKELPVSQIAKELATQYPQIKSLAITNGSKVKGTESTPIIIAIVGSEENIPKSDLTKIGQWLSVRLDSQNVKVYVEKD